MGDGIEYIVKSKVAALTEEERLDHQRDVEAALLNIKQKEEEGEKK